MYIAIQLLRTFIYDFKLKTVMVDKVEYSIVVPVYNEEGNIKKLHSEIVKVMSKISQNYEIIFVNDGSTDESLKVMRNLKPLTIIDLNRNYGQSTAFDAGFKASKGNIVISMDGDGQDDPSNIPKLLKKLKDENLDVVAGWRKNRKDNGSIRILTKIGRFFRSLFISDKIHDSGCGLRVYRKEAIKSLDIQGEMHRYIVQLLIWKGFRIGEVEVNHRPRLHGKSKYGVSKAFRGFIDLLYIWFIHKYYQRPLHLFGYASIASGLVGLLCLAESIFSRLYWGLSLNRNGFFYLGFFFLIMSLMFFSFGIIIDLLLKIHLNNSPYEKRYYTREIKEN